MPFSALHSLWWVVQYREVWIRGFSVKSRCAAQFLAPRARRRLAAVLLVANTRTASLPRQPSVLVLVHWCRPAVCTAIFWRDFCELYRLSRVQACLLASSLYHFLLRAACSAHSLLFSLETQLELREGASSLWCNSPDLVIALAWFFRELENNLS